MVDHRVIVSGSVGATEAPQLAGMGGGPPAAPQVQHIQSPNLNIMANHLREIASGTSSFGKTMQGVGKSMGIKVGVAGILKQSQLFTGMIGSIFQIAGAAVDIILAAFMPILVPAIRGIASLLPILHTVVENTLGRLVEWIVKIAEFVTGDGLRESVDRSVTDFFEKYLGEGSPTAKKMGDMSGSIVGNGVRFAVAGVALLALAKFTKVGGGLSLLFGKVTTGIRAIGKIPIVAGAIGRLSTWFKGTKFGGSIARAFGNSKVMQGIAKKMGIVKGAKATTDVAKVGKTGNWLSRGLKAIPGVAKVSKFGAKAIPIIGGIAMAAETAVNSYQNFKESMDAGNSIWKSAALGTATLGAGLGTAALGFVAPGAGLAAYEAQQMGINAMMNQFGGGPQRSLLQGTMTGTVVNFITQKDGQTVDEVAVQIDDTANVRQQAAVYNNSTFGSYHL